MNLPKKSIDHPGLRGRHHVTPDGKHIRIDGHTFKRTIIPSPTSIRKEDEVIGELETVDQKIIQELNNDEE